MLVSEIRRKTQKQRGQVTERKTLHFLKMIVGNRSIGEGEVVDKSHKENSCFYEQLAAEPYFTPTRKRVNHSLCYLKGMLDFFPSLAEVLSLKLEHF